MTRSELATYFRLSDDDIRWIRGHRIQDNHAGLAVLLTAIPFLGFVPDLGDTPTEVQRFVTDRLGIDSLAIERYVTGTEERAGQRHLEMVLDRLGWTTAGRGEWKLLDDWLIERALEHDSASVLFR